MKKNNLPIYFSLAVVFGIFIGTYFSKDEDSIVNNSSVKERKIKRLIHFIQSDYVDAVDTDKLLDGAITEMLQKLDPHSVYIPKENLALVTESMQGNFVGIGVQFRLENDSITVIRPIKGGPSIKKGITAGDRILMADNDTLFGKNLTNNAILKRLKGQPNTEVNLQVYRKTNDSIFNVIIPRGKVNIKSVAVAYLLKDSIGFIKLDRFARNTYREFKLALDELIAQGMTSLILDLRGNGGGFIDIANKIIDEFLKEEKLIVYTKNNKGDVNESFATNRGEFEDGTLYVLMDENSASASEIVAGAIQDNDRGTIIGRRSFGKGLVQQEMDLGDGSAIRLTTARYYTPTGRSIQKPYISNSKGISQSTIGQQNSNLSYQDEVNQRYENGELFHKDSIKINDSLQYKTPQGKIVFGGGGIIPDVFVSLDTTAYLPVYFFGPLNDYAFEYVDKNRKELQNLTIENFIANFDKNQTVSNAFLVKFESDNLSEKTKKQLRKNVKTLIGRNLFSEEGLYKINEQYDKEIQKVFELEHKD